MDGKCGNHAVPRNVQSIGVPYGSRTRVAAVKEKRITVIQRNFAAWIALYRTLQTHGHCYWTLNGLSRAVGFLNLLTTNFKPDSLVLT